jgi:hypothetical protein
MVAPHGITAIASSRRASSIVGSPKEFRSRFFAARDRQLFEQEHVN